jgi:ribosome maturation factor RimP
MGLLFFLRLAMRAPAERGMLIAMAALMREKLTALTEPLLARLGYELVDLEYVPARRRALLRVFIDKPEEPQGVGLSDCERVSHELSALLDVEDPLPVPYSLEVSSPGLDRILRTRTHFERFTGARVWIELIVPRDGRRRYTGQLQSVDAEGVELLVDGAIVRVPFGQVGRARLAPM